MERTIIWNNKGGTGKTSLAFQLLCDYAHSHPEKKILAMGRPTAKTAIRLIMLIRIPYL